MANMFSVCALCLSASLCVSLCLYVSQIQSIAAEQVPIYHCNTRRRRRQPHVWPPKWTGGPLGLHL